MMNFNLQRIFDRYNPEHDVGPDAPIDWAVYTLADVVRDQAKEIEDLKVSMGLLHGDALRREAEMKELQDKVTTLVRHAAVLQVFG